MRARILAVVGSLRCGSDNRRREDVIAVGNDTIGEVLTKAYVIGPQGLQLQPGQLRDAR